jgi:hypothetical protein
LTPIQRARRPWAAIAAAFALLHAAPALAAGPFDGSKPLVCTSDDSFECSDAHESCLAGDAQDLSMAELFRLDASAKQLVALAGPQEGQATSLETVRHQEGHLVVQAGRGARSLTLVIDEGTGQSTATITEVGAAFVIFGACAAL